LERRAKLFTVGCGERGKLSSPPMNNFGTPIRVARNELPWENVATRTNPNGVAARMCSEGWRCFNPFRVD